MPLRAWLLAVIVAASASPVRAHPLAPALLELRQTAPLQYDVLWRTSVSRVRGDDVGPRLPADCVEATAVTPQVDGEALVARWRVNCAHALAGQTIAISGLERSGIAVILRIQDLRGGIVADLLGPERPAIVVPRAVSTPAIFARYLRLGAQHLLSGFDHLLFIAGLVLLVRRLRPLVLTITAFTAGHSVTLCLATFDLVRVNPLLVELGIAASILVLACELARPTPAVSANPGFAVRAQPSILARRPWLMAGAFGLLHGLGFAGALAQAGLPHAEIPLALLAFNLGIEAGQLALVAAVLALGVAARRAPRHVPPRLAHSLTTYAIGSLASFWCLERALALFA